MEYGVMNIMPFHGSDVIVTPKWIDGDLSYMNTIIMPLHGQSNFLVSLKIGLSKVHIYFFSIVFPNSSKLLKIVIFSQKKGNIVSRSINLQVIHLFDVDINCGPSISMRIQESGKFLKLINENYVSLKNMPKISRMTIIILLVAENYKCTLTYHQTTISNCIDNNSSNVFNQQQDKINISHQLSDYKSEK